MCFLTTVNVISKSIPLVTYDINKSAVMKIRKFNLYRDVEAWLRENMKVGVLRPKPPKIKVKCRGINGITYSYRVLVLFVNVTIFPAKHHEQQTLSLLLSSYYCRRKHESTLTPPRTYQQPP